MKPSHLLYATAFSRALSTSATGILLGSYLAERGLRAAEIGWVVSAGLASTALSAAVATFAGDRIGTRSFLCVLTLLNLLGVVGLAVAETPLLLGLSAFVGMLNGAGRDRGAALILEQAALPAMTTNERRTSLIAGYTMLQDIGHALGGLLAGFLSLARHESVPHFGARLTLMSVAGFSAAALALYLAFGASLASSPKRSESGISAQSRDFLLRVCALFGLDSLAGGFVTTALLSYFFFERFGVGASVVGPLFFAARLMNAVSHLGAAWLAKHIGLVNTMVFTHIPSSFLLASVPFAPNFPVAVVLFLLREGLVEMDVPTRQSYVFAVIQAQERTFASGITNLVRLAGWAIAPVFAGFLMQGASLYVPLVVGAAMKIAYDLLLWRAFRSIKPPEER
ncbi:MAG: MFS transporter [Myxococcota bacterium]